MATQTHVTSARQRLFDSKVDRKGKHATPADPQQLAADFGKLLNHMRSNIQPHATQSSVGQPHPSQLANTSQVPVSYGMQVPIQPMQLQTVQVPSTQSHAVSTHNRQVDHPSMLNPLATQHASMTGYPLHTMHPSQPNTYPNMGSRFHPSLINSIQPPPTSHANVQQLPAMTYPPNQSLVAIPNALRPTHNTTILGVPLWVFVGLCVGVLISILTVSIVLPLRAWRRPLNDKPSFGTEERDDSST